MSDLFSHKLNLKKNIKNSKKQKKLIVIAAARHIINVRKVKHK